MVHKLVRTLVSLALATPLSVWGLGLGEIHLHSALNEKLDADIELLSVEPGDTETLQVGLASYEAFTRFGVERMSSLALLDFSVQSEGNRGPLIKVTSSQPIREPFLDFLVEVNWRYGRLLREYTLLIDPPELMQRQAPPTDAPAAGGAPADSTAATASTQVRAKVVSSGLSYGPIEADDTLWSIAREMRPDSSVSIQQMMIALFKANPDAFLDDNINKLRKGAVLRLDDLSLARSLTHAQAVREVAGQSRRWEMMKDELAGDAATRPQESVSEPGGPSVATREGAKLKLVAPEQAEATAPGGTGGDGEGLQAIRKELLLAVESAESQRMENEELRMRLQELEAQLASMQRLLSLKSSDLARLQGQLGEPEEGTAAPAVEAVAPVEETAPAGTAVADSADTAPAVEPAIEPVAVAGAATPKAAAEPKPVVKPEPKPAPKPVARPKPVKEVSLLDQLLANPMMLGAGGLVILLLILLGLVVRQRTRGSSFEESILTGGASSILNPKEGEGDSSMETSLLSDLADDGMGGMPVQDSEVDPITEADVYMAYGRHQQAEELLKDAIEQNPERHELLVKLMELYYKTKNVRRFETQANAAYSALDGSGPLWTKIAAWGHELVPEHPLFADAPEKVESPAAEEAQSQVAIDDVLDIGLDLDALAAEMEPSDEYGGDSEFDVDLGLDLSGLDGDDAGAVEGSGAQATAGASEAASAAGEPDMDLDMVEGGDAAAAAGKADASEDEFADLDFDFDLGQGDSGAAEEPVEASAGTEPMDGLEFDLGTAGSEEPQPAPEAAAGDGFTDLELGFEAEAAAEHADLPEPADNDVPAAAGDAGAESDLADLDFAMESGDAGQEAIAAEQSGASAGDDSGVDFSLDGLELPGEEEPQPQGFAADDDGNGLEFDLGDFKLADEEEAGSAEAGQAIPGLDLDNEFALPEEGAADEGLDVAEAATGDDLDFGGALDEAVEPVADGDFDLGDFGGGLDEALEPAADDDLELGDFSDGLDEVGTKLDLATAYVEMGDAEGAREMLEEVLKEGDDEQRNKAEELLAQIA